MQPLRYNLADRQKALRQKLVALVHMACAQDSSLHGDERARYGEIARSAMKGRSEVMSFEYVEDTNYHRFQGCAFENSAKVKIKLLKSYEEIKKEIPYFTQEVGRFVNSYNSSARFDDVDSKVTDEEVRWMR